MRDFQALQLDTNYGKGTELLFMFYISQSQYPKMSVILSGTLYICL